MTTIVPYDIYIGTTSAHASSGWTQINGSSKGASSAFTRACDWLPSGGSRFEAVSDPVGTRSGSLLRTGDVHAGMRSGTLRIVSTYTGADTGTDLRAEMQDEWATIVGSLVNAADGEIYLRFDRPDRSAATLSNVLICRVAEVPEWQPMLGRVDTGAIDIRLDIQVLYPYYVSRSGSSQAYLNATSTPVSHSLTNSGHTDNVGMLVVVDAVAGHAQVLTVANTTTGRTLELTVATIITAGDQVSYYATDPRKPALSTTNASHLATMDPADDGFLARGANTVDISVDAGQVDCTVYWYDERYTP